MLKIFICLVLILAISGCSQLAADPADVCSIVSASGTGVPAGGYTITGRTNSTNGTTIRIDATSCIINRNSGQVALPLASGK